MCIRDSIGMKVHERRLVEDVPWSTAQLFAATCARCVSLGLSVEELRTCYDVDAPVDVARLAAELTNDPGRAPRTARHLGVGSSSCSGGT